MGIRRQRKKLFQIILIVSKILPSKRHATPIVFLSKSKTSNRAVIQEGSQDYLNSKQNSKSCESLEKRLRKTFFWDIWKLFNLQISSADLVYFIDTLSTTVGNKLEILLFNQRRYHLTSLKTLKK